MGLGLGLRLRLGSGRERQRLQALDAVEPLEVELGHDARGETARDAAAREQRGRKAEAERRGRLGAWRLPAGGDGRRGWAKSHGTPTYW